MQGRPVEVKLCETGVAARRQHSTRILLSPAKVGAPGARTPLANKRWNTANNEGCKVWGCKWAQFFVIGVPCTMRCWLTLTTASLSNLREQWEVNFDRHFNFYMAGFFAICFMRLSHPKTFHIGFVYGTLWCSFQRPWWKKFRGAYATVKKSGFPSLTGPNFGLKLQFSKKGERKRTHRSHGSTTPMYEK